MKVHVIVVTNEDGVAEVAGVFGEEGRARDVTAICKKILRDSEVEMSTHTIE